MQLQDVTKLGSWFFGPFGLLGTSSAQLGGGHWFQEMGSALVSSAPLCVSALTMLATKVGWPPSACRTPENRVVSEHVEYGEESFKPT